MVFNVTSLTVPLPPHSALPISNNSITNHPHPNQSPEGITCPFLISVTHTPSVSFMEVQVSQPLPNPPVTGSFQPGSITGIKDIQIQLYLEKSIVGKEFGSFIWCTGKPQFTYLYTTFSQHFSYNFLQVRTKPLYSMHKLQDMST